MPGVQPLTRDIFRDFFELSSDMLCILSGDGRFRMVNAVFENTVGRTAETLLDRPLTDFIHPKDVDATSQALASLAAGAAKVSFEHRYRCANGTYKLLKYAAASQQDTGLLFATVKDLRSELDGTGRFRIAIDASPAAIILVDASGHIQLTNKEANQLFGYKQGDLLGRSIEILIPMKSRARHAGLFSGYLGNGEVRKMGQGRHLSAITKDGSELVVEIGLNPIDLEDGPHVLASIVDLTVQRDLENRLLAAASGLVEANAQLSKLARTDELTGLLNRRALNEQLIVHVRLMHRMSRPLSFLLIDFDHFKGLNDTYGHAAGDEALKAVAGIMTSCSRASDIAARYGGDEFAMLLPNTEMAGALKAAQKMRRKIKGHSWDHVACTISVGVSTMLFPSGELSQEADYVSALVADADRALYRSKKLGGNQSTHAAAIATEEVESY